MSDPISREPPYDSGRSSFREWLWSWDWVADFWLLVPATAIAIAVAFHQANWGIGMAAGFVAYVLLAVLYSALARVYGWRRINWQVFFWNLLGW